MNVKIIEKTEYSSLVEYMLDGLICRRIIPSFLIHSDNEVDLVDLEQGIEYGQNWGSMIDESAIPLLLELELKRKGVWTASDLLSDLNTARGAVNYIVTQQLSVLVAKSREMNKGSL